MTSRRSLTLVVGTLARTAMKIGLVPDGHETVLYPPESNGSGHWELYVRDTTTGGLSHFPGIPMGMLAQTTTESWERVRVALRMMNEMESRR